MTRRPAVLLTALLLPALSLLAPTASSAAPTTHRDGKAEGLAYVALGDSYSAGAGLEPADPTSSETCDRSTANYPHVIAGQIGADLVDVSCSGARTRDYRKSQAEGVPPQLDALSKKTRLVTQTIGGNDGGVFSSAISACLFARAAHPDAEHPCKDAQGSRFVDQVRQNTFPNLVGALNRVHKAAPKADVAILGYPWLLPATQACPGVPVADGDAPYLRHLQVVLNNVVRRAAAKTGSTYVDVAAPSDGHDACQAVGTRWIEPVVGGTNPVVLHPNTLGEEQLAAITIADLGLI